MTHPLAKNIKSTLTFLKKKKKILFLTTSTRWVGEQGGEIPKSSQVANWLAEKLGKKVTVINVSSLLIYPCEGNVSTTRGNVCGDIHALLSNKKKNPSRHHRCYASINNKDDELWKVSKPLFESDCIVFFTSIRWGQANSIYQKLIERLTWIENRHSTLGEKNIVSHINAGIIAIGQNWRGADVIKTEEQVLSFFGFKTPKALSWNWQYTKDKYDETDASYLVAAKNFKDIISSL